MHPGFSPGLLNLCKKSIDIFDISISGNYASAYCSGSITIIADYYSESDSASGYLYLQKVGNNWKIYDD